MDRRAPGEREDGRIRRFQLAARRLEEHQQREPAGKCRAQCLNEQEEAAQPALHARVDTRHDASQHRFATFLHHWRKSMKAGHKLHRPAAGQFP